MDTYDVPNIELAKVGKKRERKHGGLPLWGAGRAAGGAFSGAAGGGSLGGMSGLAATFLSKAGVIIALSIMSMAGVMMTQLGQPAAPHHKAPRPFSDTNAQKAKDYAAKDTKNLPSSGSDKSGLSMVGGGLYGDSDADKAKAAEKSDAAGKAPAAAPAAPAVPDVNAIVANATGQGGPAGDSGKSPFSTKIGALSSSLGGSGSSLGGGAGLSGGIGQAFGGPKLGEGLRSFGGSQSGAARQTASAASVRGGGAREQLNSAFSASGRAMGASGATNASYQASKAFDGITGNGQSIQNGGASNEFEVIPPPDQAPGPNQQGGPTGLSGNAGSDANWKGTGGQNIVATDVSPWAKWEAQATNWLMIGGALMMAATLLAKIHNPYTHLIAAALAAAAAVFGTMVAVRGVQMISLGAGAIQGGLFVLLGGLLATTAAIAAVSGYNQFQAGVNPAESTAATNSANMLQGHLTPDVTVTDAPAPDGQAAIDVGQNPTGSYEWGNGFSDADAPSIPPAGSGTVDIGSYDTSSYNPELTTNAGDFQSYSVDPTPSVTGTGPDYGLVGPSTLPPPPPQWTTLTDPNMTEPGAALLWEN